MIAAVFVVVFGFLFVTVASRISGLIGNSSNPVSGMTIATLMATCAMFLVAHWTASAYAVLALTIGGVVCIAAAMAGATSQDLKTGYLVGATPYWQQIGLVIGVMVSSLAVGGTLILMNVGLAQYKPMQIALDMNNLPTGVERQQDNYVHEGKTYMLVNAIGSSEIPDGKYLYDPATREIEIQWVQGIGSAQAAAPQARLMATVISGILNQRLPWRLVFLGVFLVIAVELLGIRSLPFAVGSYISIATTMAMFAGGLGALARRARHGRKKRRGERSQPRLALRQRIDRCRRRVRIARDHHQSAAGPGTEQAPAALARSRVFLLPWPRENVRFRRKIHAARSARQTPRRGAVPAARGFALRLGPQKARPIIAVQQHIRFSRCTEVLTNDDCPC